MREDREQKQDKRIIRRLIVCCMLGVFYLLFTTLSPSRIAVVLLLFLASCAAVWRNSDRLAFDRKWILLQAALLLFAWMRFYEYWSTSGRVKSLAAALSLRPELFLAVSGGAIAAAAFFGLNILLGSLRTGMLSRFLERHPVIWDLLLLLVLSVLQFVQLQRSSLDYLPNVLQIRFGYFVSNILFLLAFNLLFALLLRRERSSSIIACALITVFSAANYYVILFHGSPLFPGEFANAKTAVNVLSGYRFSISPQIVDVIALFFAELFLSARFCRLKWRGRVFCGALAAFVCGAAVVYAMLFSPIALKGSWRFSWNASVMYSGFISSAANDVKDSLHPVVVPEGYDAAEILVPAVDNTAVTEEYPDIILILNETFCDLDVYSDIQADRDYLAPFYGIRNASYGIAFAPGIGGGTNDSEFELLNSDSTAIMASSAPFNYMDFNEKNSTLLTYLHSLGYTATAMHSSTPYNYSRDKAYPALGFDHVYLGAGSFSAVGENGSRPILDSDDYQGMISLYEQDAEGPRFYYLLTYQNHGGWEQNDAALDTVHTAKDCGDLTDDIDEYLSSVQLSAEAFRELTDYFQDVERPVIVCMVGDHAPSFIRQLEGNGTMSSEEAEVWQRAVPYVIWANYDLDPPAEEQALLSMTDLVPRLLAYAHMPLTPYYQQILKVRDSLPVRLQNGLCMDNAGVVRSYIAEDPLFDEYTQYLYMEYNGITASEDYLAECFLIP